MSQPLILLTNDDGIRSPGLLAAVRAVADLGSLVVVAPDMQQTGMSRAMSHTFDGVMVPRSLPTDGQQVPAYSLAGSPAQAVLYAVVDLLDSRPDLVISGINYGENPGTSSTASGTIGAALQAADLGIPALAVSVETEKAGHLDSEFRVAVDWAAAIHFTRYFAQAMLEKQLPPDVDVLKIDVPASATPQTPWRLTRQSRQSYYTALPTGRTDLRRPQSIDYEVFIDHERLEPNSDIYAFAVERVVTVTPLSLDLTSRADMEKLRQLLSSTNDRSN